MSTKELDYDELIGAVKHKSQWRFFAGTIAEWNLDYASYDPGYDPSKSSYLFRGGLLTVDETKADAFCIAMSEHELSHDDVRSLVAEKGAEKVPLTVVVNFDEKLFVNGFYDLAIEEYVPTGWRGVFDDPLKYVPDEVRAIWQPLQPQADYRGDWRRV